VAYIDGSLEKETGNKDNFTEMLPLYTVGNPESRTLGEANFDRAIEKCQKAIKLHSIKRRPKWTKSRKKTEKDLEWLNRKEYNPFLWKAWLLMGRAQFMKGSFDEAASTFAYMSRLYATQPAIYGRARAWLAKCYIEQDWIYDAEDVMTKMRRDSIHWRARKEWDYTYADYYIHTGQYAEAIPYLRKVIKHEMRCKQKAREWYLMGQLEAALGHEEKAYKAYKRVLRLSPPYELAFNARIAMTEVMAGRKSGKMIKKLKRMARSENNKDYLDQVYYAIGNIYLNQKDTLNAISAYEQGNIKSTRNGIEKGVLLLKLGDLYWEREDYDDARRCYGEAIGLLDKEREDYEQLSDRSKVLDELVPYTDAVHLQDSLQALAKMPEAERNAAIDRVIEALKEKEKAERDAQAEAEAQQYLAQQGGAGNNAAQNGMQTGMTDSKGTWYFYNPMAVSQGKATFQKLWGRRENVDDWQRVNKTVVAQTPAFEELTDEQRDSIAAVEAMQDSIENAMDSAHNDPHKREYYLKQIPFTPEQVAESNKIIEDGLFHSGVIFKDKLDNLTLSEKNLRRLSDNYKDYENMDEAYYHLFLLYSRRHEKSQADTYLALLKRDFPESEWTALLADPNYEVNARFGVHIEDSLYAATYNAFKADRFDEVAANTSLSASRFPLGANRDKFIFIGGLSKLNSGDSEGCLADMQELISKYPESDVGEMAGMIINGVKAGRPLYGGKFDISDVWERRTMVLNDSDSIAARTFVAERNTPFSFLLVYQPDSVDGNKLLFELARFNFTNFIVRNFDIALDEQGGLHRMIINGFMSYDEALQYARQLYGNANIARLTKKARAIIISDTNLELLGTQYSYNDYDKFYEQHFVPLKVSTVRLLTEPATIEYEPGDEIGSDGGDGLYNGGVIEGGLFIEDEPAAPQQDTGTTLIMDEEENNQPTDNTGAGTIVIPETDEPATPQVDGGTTIIPDTPQEQAEPAGQQPAAGTIIIPDTQDNAPLEEPQGTGNTFTIEDEPEAQQPAAEVPETQGGMVIPIEPETAPQTTPVQKTANEPAKDGKTQAEKLSIESQKTASGNTGTDDVPDDGLIIEFNDGFGGNEDAGNNTQKEDNRQDGFDLEDEYYELDGF
jgi:tetratricopeptide (TPR) repeat protein